MIPAMLVEESPSRPTDAEVLARWMTSRDHQAFDELHRRHGSLVLQAARRRGSPDPDDAVQLVFLTLFRTPESVGDATRLTGWLLGVTRKIVANQVRTAHRRARHEHHGALVDGAVEPAPTDDDQAFAAVAPHLDDALGQLSAGRREAIIRIYLQGRPPNEVAAELGCSRVALRVRLHEGLALLQRMLQRHHRGDLSVVVLGGLLTRAGGDVVGCSGFPGGAAAHLAAVPSGVGPAPAATLSLGKLLGVSGVVLAVGVGFGLAPLQGQAPAPAPAPASVAVSTDPAVPAYLFSQEGHRWKYPTMVNSEALLMRAIRRRQATVGLDRADPFLRACLAAMEELHQAVLYGDEHHVRLPGEYLVLRPLPNQAYAHASLEELVREARQLLEPLPDAFAGHLTAAMTHCQEAEASFRDG